LSLPISVKFQFAPLFTDNLVLQQGMPISVWGTAEPGEHVEAAFRGQCAETKADETSGHWKLTLAPLTPSAEPAQLLATATASGGKKTHLACHNVLTGEVWVCSGQSNMEWPVALARDAEQEIAAADFLGIRLFTVPQKTATEPALEISGDPSPWLVCSPDTIRRPSPDHPSGFSAVAYFFGRELHRRLGVPIGLINASVGGTCAETWTSRQGLLADPAVRETWDSYERGLPDLDRQEARWQEEMRALEARTRDTGNAGLALGYAGAAEPAGDWRDMTLPGNWRRKGLDFHGIVWFRLAVEIPDAWAGRDLRLSLGAADKSDTTYFNGARVGGITMQDREDAWSVPRIYTVPGGLVRAGRNVLAVRVHSNKNDAGLMGPAGIMSLGCPALPDAAPLTLAGIWRYAVEANYGNVIVPPRPQGPGNLNSPTALFNGMIAPLTSFALRGAIWYQGEHNVSQALAYRSLFPALIRDWRRQWGRDDLAFHFVQLANYLERKEQPDESPWAELREAQTWALRLPHTGMAVAIDVGEADDIHPRNKQDVGLRLAWSVLHGEYGLKDVTPSGPRFREARREGDALRLLFDYAETGLVCRGKSLQGFAVAGSNRIFAWASARIEGATVVVSSPVVPAPELVRYAWADNPICNLYSGAGLPASPFHSEVQGSSGGTPFPVRGSRGRIARPPGNWPRVRGTGFEPVTSRV
jgi:sialate O-acetylesterase